MATDAIGQNGSAHKLTLCGRQRMEIFGVRDVVRFDEQSVMLDTSAGGLEILGDGLHIHVLNLESGVVALDGRIDSVAYDEVEHEGGSKSGFFGKLFHS